MSDISSKVVDIIVDKLGVDAAEVVPTASFTNDLGADSLDTVELIMEFEKEFEIEYVGDRSLPYTVEKDEDGIYVVEGPRIEKMLGYTNLDSEKGFDFFQKFLKQSGILADLEKAGIQEGDTVRMYGLVFDYYK